jgi:hypothetical protein|tara:strand:+ start:1223 stop:1405 length:183 start_codon:yes stop_codon:yes gene_type:complete
VQARLTLRGIWVQNSFFAYAKNLGKCGELLFGRSPGILLRKIKKADEIPSLGVYPFCPLK